MSGHDPDLNAHDSTGVGAGERDERRPCPACEYLIDVPAADRQSRCPECGKEWSRKELVQGVPPSPKEVAAYKAGLSVVYVFGCLGVAVMSLLFLTFISLFMFRVILGN